nr:hypothetical protein [Tanacetum cinerariifolium]
MAWGASLTIPPIVPSSVPRSKRASPAVRRVVAKNASAPPTAKNNGLTTKRTVELRMRALFSFTTHSRAGGRKASKMYILVATTDAAEANQGEKQARNGVGIEIEQGKKSRHAQYEILVAAAPKPGYLADVLHERGVIVAVAGQQLKAQLKRVAKGVVDNAGLVVVVDGIAPVVIKRVDEPQRDGPHKLERERRNKIGPGVHVGNLIAHRKRQAVENGQAGVGEEVEAALGFAVAFGKHDAALVVVLGLGH